MVTDPNRVKEIFLGATEQADEAARAAYLDGACEGDAGLRDRVEALLRSHDPAGSFLRNPVVKSPQTNDATQEMSVDRAATPDDDANAADDLQFLSPSTRPDSLGRLGHYEMLQVLGKGGFGIVFRAFDDTLQRVVAVKVMAPQIATLSPARKRFLREAQSSAAVRHENVVQVYEVVEKPLPYLAMEFIPGETLQQKLDRCGPLDVSEVLRIGRQVAEGLAAAHACDLIHRDIKPGNILLEGGSHKAKITDFGLARAADDASISQSGVVAGTPMFMAPEQALGHKIDQRADLFSLGSVLYQMASGRPPFRAPSALAVLKRVAEEPPRPIPEIIPETPDWLCGIIAKLHAKNPDDRFQSAREVAELLADCEAKLKAKQEVKNILPAAAKPPAPTGSAGRKWVAAATILLLPLITLAVTEFAGVTHLFRGQQGTTDPIKTAKHEPPPLAIAPFDAAQAKQHQEAWAKHLGVPVEFTNSIGMTFRLIPPGEFTMGTSPEEAAEIITHIPKWAKERVLSETPARKVRIPEPFYLGTTEVTVGHFKQFVAATNYKTQAESNGKGGLAWTGDKIDLRPDFTWRHPDLTQSDSHPVGQLCPTDANVFCRWLHDRDGRTHELPNEEQWECACRAGTVTPWSCGTDAATLKQQGLNGWDLGFSGRAVAQKPPNPFGLFDVHGNFEEMCRCKDGSYVARGGHGGLDNLMVRCAARTQIGRLELLSIHGFRVAIVGHLKGKTPPLAVAPFDD